MNLHWVLTPDSRVLQHDVLFLFFIGSTSTHIDQKKLTNPTLNRKPQTPNQAPKVAKPEQPASCSDCDQ